MINVKFKPTPICHKGGRGNYKIIPEKKITYDLDRLEKKEGFKTRRPTKAILIMEKDDISWVFSNKNGHVMIENVVPDTPEKALELLMEALN